MLVRRRNLFVGAMLLCLGGMVGMTLAQDETETPPKLSSLPVLDIGTSVDGELSADTPSAIYRFAGEEGDVIIIGMHSDEIDPVLRLDDAEGNELLSNDDLNGSGVDARIGPIMLPDEGDYVLTATSFDYDVSEGSDVEEGAYTLTLERIEPVPLDSPGDIEANMDAEHSLYVFSFEGQQGDVLSIGMDSDEIDSYLAVASATNLEGPVRRDDDSGEGIDALVIPFIVPETGTYFITATSYDADAEGEFEVEIDRLETAPITIGTPVEGELSEDTRVLIYTFEGEADQTISATVDSEADLDTTMTILGPDGSQVAYNDDADASSTRAPAVVGLQLLADGTYQIVIAPFSIVNYGPIRLTLSEG